MLCVFLIPLLEKGGGNGPQSLLHASQGSGEGEKDTKGQKGADSELASGAMHTNIFPYTSSTLAGSSFLACH